MKWIILLAFGGLGLVALVSGLIWGWYRYSLMQGGVHATGIVVDQQETQGTRPATTTRSTGYSRSSISYNPVVEFTDKNGETHRFVGSTGGAGKPIIETGTEVAVIYNPTNPTNAQITSFQQFWLGPVVVGVSGLVFLLMGVGALLLTGSDDRWLAEQAEMMQRERLIFATEAPTFEAKILRTEEQPTGSGRYVFVCRGTRPGAVYGDEFISDFFPFDPGPRYQGRRVTVHIDPTDPGKYFVNIGALLPEIMKSRP